MKFEIVDNSPKKNKYEVGDLVVCESSIDNRIYIITVKGLLNIETGAFFSIDMPSSQAIKSLDTAYDVRVIPAKSFELDIKINIK